MSAHTSDGLSDDVGLLSQIFNWLKAWQAQAFGPDADVASSLGHFSEYFVFGALFANAWRLHEPPARAWLLALACASLYGVTDEIHQFFVPTRTPDVADWMVDTCAAAIGAGVSCAVLRWRARRASR